MEGNFVYSISSCVVSNVRQSLRLRGVDVQQEERQMGTTDASKEGYEIVPLHFDMAAEVRHQAIDRDQRVPVRHRGDGSDCEFGHVGADLVWFFKVGFPVEPGRERGRESVPRSRLS